MPLRMLVPHTNKGIITTRGIKKMLKNLAHTPQAKQAGNAAQQRRSRRDLRRYSAAGGLWRHTRAG